IPTEPEIGGEMRRVKKKRSTKTIMRVRQVCPTSAFRKGAEDGEEEEKAATSGEAASDGLAVRDPAAVDRAAVAARLDRGADRPTPRTHAPSDPLCDQHPGVSDALCRPPAGPAQDAGSQDVPPLA